MTFVGRFSLINFFLIMDHLPLDLIDNILFRLNSVSMVVMGCTNEFLRTYISDPKFDSYRFSGVGSSLFYISRHTPYYISCSCQKNILSSYPCYILGSCSGLLLLDVGGCVFVANPFTNRFRFLDHSGSKILYDIVTCVNRADKATCVGFAVDRIQDRLHSEDANDVWIRDQRWTFLETNGDNHHR